MIQSTIDYKIIYYYSQGLQSIGFGDSNYANDYNIE